VAEPRLEQRLLHGVHVLVLVHGEGLELRAHLRGRLRVLLIQEHGHPEHVLEVDLPGTLLAALVALEHPRHQLDRDRRNVVEPLDLGEVSSPRDHAVLRPLDLAGELAPWHEPVGRRECVREGRDQRRLRRQHLGKRVARMALPEPTELGEGGGMERAGLDAAHAERGETFLQLPGGLLGEGHGQDPIRREGAGRHLVGDSTGDRGGLAGAGAREDRDGATHRHRGLALGVVQSLQDRGGGRHAATLPASPDSTDPSGIL